MTTLRSRIMSFSTSTLERLTVVGQKVVNVLADPTQLNWPLFFAAFAASQTIFLGGCEGGLMSSYLAFVNTSLSPKTIGFSPVVAVYFGIFLIAVFFVLIGTLDAHSARSSMQTLTASAFQVLMIVFSIIQIFHLSEFHSCVQSYQTISASPTLDDMGRLGAIWNLEQGGCPFRTVNSINDTFFFLVDSNLTPQNISQRMSAQMDSLNTAFSLAYIVVVFAFLFAGLSAYLSFKTTTVYGWEVYQSLSVEQTMRIMCSRFHFFIVFLKLNVYFAIISVFQLLSAVYYWREVELVMMTIPKGIDGATLQLGTNRSTPDTELRLNRILLATVSGAVILVSMLYFPFGFYGVKQGSRLMMAAFFVLMAMNASAATFMAYSALFDVSYRVMRIWLMATSMTLFVVSCALVTIGVMLMYDFDNGLPGLVQKIAEILPGDPVKDDNGENKMYQLQLYIRDPEGATAPSGAAAPTSDASLTNATTIADVGGDDALATETKAASASIGHTHAAIGGQTGSSVSVLTIDNSGADQQDEIRPSGAGANTVVGDRHR